MPFVPKEPLRYPRSRSDDRGKDVQEYVASLAENELDELPGQGSAPPIDDHKKLLDKLPGQGSAPSIDDPKKLLAKLPEKESDPPVTPPEHDSSVPASTSILKIGDTGEEIKHLQRFLNLPQDGIFGQNTFNAVKKFQRDHGLDSDGVVGAHTQGRIDELLAENELDKLPGQGSAPPIDDRKKPPETVSNPLVPPPDPNPLVTDELVRIVGKLEGIGKHTDPANKLTYPFGVTKTFIDAYNDQVSNKNEVITAEAYEKAPNKYIAPLMEYHFRKLQEELGFGKLQKELGLSDKWNEMPPGVKNAVFSLTWNIGVGGAPELMKKLKIASKEEGESSRHEAYVKALREEALDAFLAGDKGEKKAILMGLAKRRAQEYNLAGEGLEGFIKIATVKWDKPNVVYIFADDSTEEFPVPDHDLHSKSNAARSSIGLAVESILDVKDPNGNVKDLEEPLRYPKDVQEYVASLAENENVEDSKETEQQAESISASPSVRSSKVMMEDRERKKLESISASPSVRSSKVMMEDREARERNQKLTPVDDLDDNLNFLTRLHPDDDTAREHSAQRPLALIPTRATQPQRQAVRDPDDEPTPSGIATTVSFKDDKNEGIDQLNKNEAFERKHGESYDAFVDNKARKLVSEGGLSEEEATRKATASADFLYRSWKEAEKRSGPPEFPSSGGPVDYNGKDYTVRGGVVPAKTLTSLKIDVVPPNVAKSFFAHESPNIDAWWSGAVNVNPELEEFSASTKTIGEVLRKQTDVKTAIRADNKKRNVDNPVSSAVGKYQIVGNTLREAMRSPEIKALGITNDTVFDEPTQDKIMLYYLMRVKQPKLREYFNTPKPTEERLRKAMAALGREWEAFRVGKHGERDAEEIVKTMHAYYKRFGNGRMTL